MSSRLIFSHFGENPRSKFRSVHELHKIIKLSHFYKNSLFDALESFGFFLGLSKNFKNWVEADNGEI